jgi:hypothetical protein
VARRKTARIGKRKTYYLARIEADLVRARLGRRQVERAWEPGWTKLKEYSRHLAQRNVEDWTTFALRYPFEVVQQAARRGKPSLARTPIVSIMFRIHKPLRDLFVLALEERGWVAQPGKTGGHKVSVERALERLIVEAVNFDALNSTAHRGDTT